MAETERIYGHCRACHMNCPAYFVVEGDTIHAIEPVPPEEGGTGVICGRGVGTLQLMYSPTRVKYPLKRVGKRGEGKWERISWDQAIEEVAQKIYDMSVEYGPETFVLPGRTGRQDMGWIAHKIARTIGTPNNYYGAIQVCLLPQIQHQAYFGVMLTQPYFSDPSTTLHLSTGTEAGYCWPIMGGAQIGSEMAGNYKKIAADPVCGPYASRADEWLPMRPGTDLAYYLCMIRHLIEKEGYQADFVKQWTNAPFLVRADTGNLLLESDIVEGGSSKRYMFWDAASDSLKWWDTEEIQWEGGVSGKAHYEMCEDNFWKHIGTTELSPAVMPEGMDPALRGVYDVKVGKHGRIVKCKPAFELLYENAAEWTFEKTSEVTWVPAEQLERVCDMVCGVSPVDFFDGAQYMSTNASQFFSALNVLKMLTGSVDANPGNMFTQFYPVIPQPFPGEFDLSYADGLSLEQKRKRLGYYEHRLGCGYAWEEWRTWHPQLPENADATLNFPDVGQVLNAAETGRPYPVHGIIAISSNWIMHDPSTARWMRLLEDEEKIQLHVVTDFVMTPTAEMADYVFPAQTWMERNYLEFSPMGSAGGFKNAFRRAVEPLGEARHDYDFGAALAHALEKIDPRYNNDRLLNPDNSLFWAGKVGKLWENDTIDEERDRWCREFSGMTWEECMADRKVPAPSTPTIPFKRYLVSGKFPTDTGKANMFSTLHQMCGYSPLPKYTEPAESPVSRPDIAADYPLVLTTGKRQANYFHSEFRQLPWLRETNPTPEVFINPETAAEYGVTHGDWVWVESSPTHGRAPLNKIMGRVSFRLIARPGVVSYSQHAWWRPEKPANEDGHGGIEWNAECLLETVNSAPETGTAGLRSQLCKIYKASDEDIARYQPMVTREQLEALMPKQEEEI